jgi:hypothetical protein
MHTALNIAISAVVIGFAAWLGGRHPRFAGFLVALPLATLLVLPLAQLQHHDAARTVVMARSILVAVPLTLTFFVPFLLADRLHLGFWSCYVLGILCLVGAFFLHRLVLRAVA